MSSGTGNRHGLWARLRFAIIGRLLSSPPNHGELKSELEALAAREWQHPITKEPHRFSFATIERWYYAARKKSDPMRGLRSKVRKDAGSRPSFCEETRKLLHEQYEAHPSWTYQLHADNLAALCHERGIEPVPSYASVRRYMKSAGLIRKKRRRRRDTAGFRRAQDRERDLEIRSYEAEYVGGLWHLDFHHGSRRVLLADGRWRKPVLLCVIDDRSRLVCHLQWYLDETVESLVHGVSQALQKRGLPRALMTDNGPAMKAAEFVEGLEGEHGLSIVHERTLEYSPYQNAKQEVFFAIVEGRLMAMVEGERELTLSLLNEATQAWAELDYHRRIHSETKETPIERFLAGPDVLRECPDSDELRRRFRATLTRRQRKSDGTVAVHGMRFEVPSRYRTLERTTLRCARWDMRAIDMIDPRHGNVLCSLQPLDKARNADGHRKRVTPLADGPPDGHVQDSGIAPLLKKLIADYSATGLPPAYLPTEEDPR